MKKHIGFLILLASCKPNKLTHEYQITDSQFIEVMADLYIAEQVVRSSRYGKDSLMQSLETQIFKMHDIKDTMIFKQDLKILMNDQQKYQVINDSVIARLNTLKEIKTDK